MIFSKKNLTWVAVVIILIGVYFVFFNSDSSDSSGNQTRELVFLMAHKPDNKDNVALIQDFADIVYKQTKGTVHITPLDPQYQTGVVGESADTPILALEDISNGTASIAQISLKRFPEVYPELFPLLALDALQVFRSHEHTAHVLDGDVGRDLLQMIDEHTDGKLRGLDFTYSGGYRNIFSTVPIHSLSDLKGLSMRNTRLMSKELMDSLGIITLDTVDFRSSRWEEGMLDGSIELEEAENLRIESYRIQYPEIVKKIDTIVETNHSMFLTALVFNASQFDSLTSEQQAIVSKEARTLALKERELSIQQSIDSKERFQNEGVAFLSLNDADQKTLTEKSNAIRAQHEDTLSEWFKRIEAVE
ncbi:TRAP transporter substrate-binding protein DctP [Candidatus Kaiserbacteria bacterium]|nr:TRAP transporter substrate-binding protein DctP [Candidatus Kaiserbacteria bacterium]